VKKILVLEITHTGGSYQTEQTSNLVKVPIVFSKLKKNKGRKTKVCFFCFLKSLPLFACGKYWKKNKYLYKLKRVI
jgi:hypothetical protein